MVFVFIPMVVNAALCRWGLYDCECILKRSANSLYQDEGDKTDAFHPEKV